MVTEKRIRLYRTLIAVGVVLAIASAIYGAFVGMNPPLVLWVPVAYALLAWALYSIVVKFWRKRTHQRAE